MKPKRNYGENPYIPMGMDLCQTPRYAITPLLPYLDKSKILFDPAMGKGYLVQWLELEGYSVIASDLQMGYNFLVDAPPTVSFDVDQSEVLHVPDIQVTNPPYSLKYKWLARSYELGIPFALLLPLETLGAKKAQTLFREYGMELIILDRRVNFMMPNKGWENSAAQFPVAWFTWGLNIGRDITYAKLRGRKYDES